jgi:hypothetical protein
MNAFINDLLAEINILPRMVRFILWIGLLLTAVALTACFQVPTPNAQEVRITTATAAVAQWNAVATRNMDRMSYLLDQQTQNEARRMNVETNAWGYNITKPNNPVVVPGYGGFGGMFGGGMGGGGMIPYYPPWLPAQAPPVPK